jgi:hypothetical protein
MNLTEQARELAKTRGEEMQRGWNLICDAIHPWALAQRPLPRSFEVHHVTETARAQYLKDLVAGASVDAAVTSALARVNVPAHDVTETQRS